MCHSNGHELIEVLTECVQPTANAVNSPRICIDGGATVDFPKPILQLVRECSNGVQQRNLPCLVSEGLRDIVALELPHARVDVYVHMLDFRDFAAAIWPS